MTERIDLDDVDDSAAEAADDDDHSFEDALWSDDRSTADLPDSAESAAIDDSGEDGDSDRVPEDAQDAARDDGPPGDAGPEANDGPPSPEDVAREGDDDAGSPEDHRIPHVPRSNKGNPAGIPKASGGSGSGAAPADRGGDVWDDGGAAGSDARDTPAPGNPEGAGSDGSDADQAGERSHGTDAEQEASGPHGGGADDMTMALTYGAVQRLADPREVLADANTWTDWVGIVGDVAPHVINSFQREHGLDVDFFSGSDPAGERLARIDHHSMFYADRMVVVGVAGAHEHVAEESGWEFVPLDEAAGEADWKLSE